MSGTAKTKPGKAAHAAAEIRLGRPRRPEIDGDVIRATVELMREVAFSGLSLEMIAERAGVAKPTIYRRWPSKAALVADVVARLVEPQELSTDEDVKEQVRTHLLSSYRRLSDAGIMHILPSIVGETILDTELGESFRARYVVPKRRILETVLKRGVAEGILRKDLDVFLMHKLLAGPELYSWFLDGKPLSYTKANRIFEEVWKIISVEGQPQ